MASVTILSDNGATSGSAGLKTSGGNDGTMLLQTTTSGGTPTTAITIDNTQNTGLGVTPSAWGSGSQALQNQAGALFTVGSGSLRLFQNAYYNGTNNIYVNTAAATGYIQAGGQHQWFYASSGSAGANATFTQAMTLDASGNLMLGTTTQAGRVAIKQADTNWYNGIRVFNSSSNTWTGIGNTGSLAVVSSSYDSSGSYLPLAFYTSDTERMRVNAGAPILCLSGGNTTATGTGIAFPATQSASSDANTLDDYEEGTFTPTLTFGGTTGSGTGISYSMQLGSYIKVGRMVYLNARIVLSSKGSATGNARLTGLPFNFVGGFSGNEMSIGAVWYNSWNNASNYAVNIRQDTTSNSTFLEFRSYASGSELAVTETWFNNNSAFNITIVVIAPS